MIHVNRLQRYDDAAEDGVVLASRPRSEGDSLASRPTQISDSLARQPRLDSQTLISRPPPADDVLANQQSPSGMDAEALNDLCESGLSRGKCETVKGYI